ncbi:hypothetical protein [Rufibacter hautae]|uniref:Outer membrane protein beta-barrel domain-containing protein n=1 Tax=Rufibacter hautae TaxID=2595005 RepID=A0A5B6TAH8_9BACT|nr:hypothetical protein [Rufibacter hautae]KAA3435961.1 hypothetical protein FOA19_22700 [Rufibacter hautae]
MKKALLSLLLFIGLGTLSPALAQRHVKHISAWGVHYGRTEMGKFYEGSYINYLTDKLSVRVSGLREFGDLEVGEYSAFSGRGFLAPQLFRIGEFAYFHLLLGGAASYERTGEGSNSDRRERFTYGPQAGAEVDFFFGNRISLVATGIKGKMFNKTHLDEWPGFISLGLRYHFR